MRGNRHDRISKVFNGLSYNISTENLIYVRWSWRAFENYLISKRHTPEAYNGHPPPKKAHTCTRVHTRAHLQERLQHP